MSRNELYFGTAYCPYAKSGDIAPEFFERDVITMKKLGMNIIRPFVAWDRIERKEGVYEYDKLDLIFDLAEKHGLKILLNLGGTLTAWGAMYPPRYLLRRPDIQEQELKPGEKQFGPVRQLCMDDPYYMERAKIFLEKTAKRYCNHPALGAWSLWNEPFYHGDGCFCKLTLAKFREFLREKYHNDIQELNKKWGTEFPVDYQDFSEAEPGVYVSFSGGGYGPCLDYLKFNRARVAEWLKVVRNTIDRNNPRRLQVSVNVVVTAVYNTAHNHSYPSMFEQNYIADIPGFSAYTFFGQMEEAPFLMAAANAWCRSAGRDPGKGFWAIEGEAGQINYFQDRKDRGERGWRIASNWQLAANGARMLMFWKFSGRVTDTQTDQFNLTALDGSVTDRAKLLSDSCKAFLRLKDFIADSCVHAETAILFAPDTELARICDKTYKEYVDACHGAFRILNELHIECDFVNERLLREKRGRYKVIIAPETIFLNRKFAEELKQFISGGGTLITDYRFAQKREDSFQFQTLPGYDLQEAAGIFVNDFTYAERDEVFSLEGFPAVPLKDLLRAKLQLKDAESLADYIHGGCALSVHSFGKGKYVCWGFSPFSVFRTAKSTEQLGGIREMFRRFCADAGAVSDFKITGDDKHQLQTGTLCRDDAHAGEKTCFLINFADEPLECKAELPGREQETTELLSGKLFPGKTLSLKFAPFETMIFSCR